MLNSSQASQLAELQRARLMEEADHERLILSTGQAKQVQVMFYLYVVELLVAAAAVILLKTT